MTREEQINGESFDRYMQYTVGIGSKGHVGISDPDTGNFSVNDLRQAFEDGAEWADEHPKTSWWISIEKQLPPVGKLVLWRGYRETLVAYRDEHNCINYKGGYFGTIHSLEIDRWAPIPE